MRGIKILPGNEQYWLGLEKVGLLQFYDGPLYSILFSGRTGPLPTVRGNGPVLQPVFGPRIQDVRLGESLVRRSSVLCSTQESLGRACRLGIFCFPFV
jgi:hypothetical protein